MPAAVEEFDHVVIGGGAAGCVLASRLSEDPDDRVVLLEAGSALEGEQFSVPAAAISLQEPGSPWLWGDFSTPQDALGGRRVSMLAGRALGGGSAVNGMLWFRGHPLDYDGWEAQGATGWGWTSVAPAFRTLESFDGGPDEHHGAGGPMAVSGVRDLNPVSCALVAAGVERGLAVNPDANGADLDGIGPAQTNIRDGARFSVLDGYLAATPHRTNLTVRTSSPVATLVTEGGRVTGVRLAGGTELRARRGVVLAAGALRTPQLLMCSGIGPADHLRGLGVEVVLDLPGVGAGLQDQPLVGGLWPVTGERAPTDAWADVGEPAYRLLRRGPQASYMQVNAMLRSGEQEPAPDVQVIMGPLDAGAAQQLGMPEPVALFTCTPVVLTPDSRGTVRLASSDPQAPPLVDPGYLREQRDRDRLREATAWVRDQLFTAPALRGVFGPPAGVPPTDAGRDALDAYLTESAGSSHHMVGSCRMGTDAGAVVDPHLAVHCLDGLHVADASVMPSSVRGNPQAAVIMIAERAAAFLRDGREPSARASTSAA